MFFFTTLTQFHHIPSPKGPCRVGKQLHMEASENHKQTKNPSISKQETRSQSAKSRIDVFFICWEEFQSWTLVDNFLLDFYISATITPTFPCVHPISTKTWRCSQCHANEGVRLNCRTKVSYTPGSASNFERIPCQCQHNFVLFCLEQNVQ